jgi:hypothetical protein
VPELRIHLGTDGLAKFDEVKADLTRYLGSRQSSRVTLDVLCYLYKKMKSNGELATMLSTYPGSTGEFEVR